MYHCAKVVQFGAGSVPPTQMGLQSAPSCLSTSPVAAVVGRSYETSACVDGKSRTVTVSVGAVAPQGSRGGGGGGERAAGFNSNDPTPLAPSAPQEVVV